MRTISSAMLRGLEGMETDAKAIELGRRIGVKPSEALGYLMPAPCLDAVKVAAPAKPKPEPVEDRVPRDVRTEERRAQALDRKRVGFKVADIARMMRTSPAQIRRYLAHEAAS